MKTKPLSQLPLGQTANIISLNTGQELHRRLLELGFFPGNHVTPLYCSPLRDPVAYWIMGSVIALRHEEAGQIVVFPL